jgi:hypothetical protein
MYKEYRFPIQDETKARRKQEELQKTYGVKIPAYKIQTASGDQWFSLVYPEGLQPKVKKR